MSYPPQDPFNAGAPAPGTGYPTEGQYNPPPNPAAPQPAYGTPAAPPSYDQGFAAGGFDQNQGFGPASAPPAPPFSAPPTSGAPATAVAYGPPAGGSKGKSTVLILAIVAGLLFVLGGVMTGLFITKNSELNDTRKDLTAQVADRDNSIATKDGEITKLQSDLKKAQDDLAATNQTLTGTQNDRDRIEQEKAAISKCLNLVTEFISALAEQNQAKAEQLADDLAAPCDEAEKYL